MTDAECVAFLQWALPRIGMRWAGYRRVRGQVRKRIGRRLVELGLADVAAYRARLEADPSEWNVLEGLCVVTISRFYRDRLVWDTLREHVLPAMAEAALAAGDEELRCWSAGCASGEEPYTLSVLWMLDLAHRYPGLRLRIVATDVHHRVLARAREAKYSAGTLRELPPQWRDQAFEQRADTFCLRERFRSVVELRQQDVRRVLPEEAFHVILCRNSVFTYLDENTQQATLARMSTRLAAGGAFLVGPHERLPAGALLVPQHASLGIYRTPGVPGAPVVRAPCRRTRAVPARRVEALYRVGL